MPKVLHVSFLWDDDTVNQRHSDYILSMGWVKEGWDVLYFDYRGTAEEYGNDEMNNALVNIIMQHNPDIVWFTKSEGVSRRWSRRSVSCSIKPATIRRVRELGFKGKIIHWFLDQRYDFFKNSLEIGKECDWFFYVSGGDRLKAYSQKMKTPASFIIVPYEPTFMKPLDFKNRSIDLIWMGGAHKPNKNQFENTRYELLRQLISSGDLQHYYGCFHKKKILCPEYQSLLGRSQMGLSLYAFDRPMYFSNRVSHIIGSGTALFSYDFKQREKIFTNDEGIFFKDTHEFKKKKKYFKENPDELQWIAENGHKKAKTYFTSSRVVEEILHTLQNGKSAYPFGQTYNPKGIKYEIPTSQKEYGDIFYLDRYGNFINIDEYSTQNTEKERQRRTILEQNRRRAEKLKALHLSRHNPRLTKRADKRIVNRKPKFL